MLKKYLVLSLFLSLIWMSGTLVAQPAEQELILEQGVNGYEGTRDTSLFEEGDLSNGGGQHLFAGRTDQPNLRRALVAFDLSDIPAGSTIVAVQFQVTISKTQFQRRNSDMFVHRLTADWGEGEQDAAGEEGRGTEAAMDDATWTSNFHQTSTWENEGGDFVEAESGMARTSGTGSTMTFEGDGMVADVQAWVDGEAENFGWIIVGEGQARRFYSSESEDVEPGQKPRLVIRFVPPS